MSTQPALMPISAAVGVRRSVIQPSVPSSVVASGSIISMRMMSSGRPSERTYAKYAATIATINAIWTVVLNWKSVPSCRTIRPTMISAPIAPSSLSMSRYGTPAATRSEIGNFWPSSITP
jgi:hypothetical protein